MRQKHLDIYDKIIQYFDFTDACLPDKEATIGTTKYTLRHDYDQADYFRVYTVMLSTGYEFQLRVWSNKQVEIISLKEPCISDTQNIYTLHAGIEKPNRYLQDRAHHLLLDCLN